MIEEGRGDTEIALRGHRGGEFFQQVVRGEISQGHFERLPISECFPPPAANGHETMRVQLLS